MRTFLTLGFCTLSLIGANNAVAQATAKQTAKAVDILAEDVLKTSKHPGGIELISGCDVPVARALPLESENLDIALTSMAERERHLTWTKTGTAYTVTIQLMKDQGITSVRLPALQMSANTLPEATDKLLQAAAVRERIVSMKLTELTENLGFTSINEGQEHNIGLPAGTLREDLNALATAFGTAIWKLDQRQCGNNRTVRISWIAR
jgi:hypothetical protein